MQKSHPNWWSPEIYLVNAEEEEDRDKAVLLREWAHTLPCNGGLLLTYCRRLCHHTETAGGLLDVRDMLTDSWWLLCIEGSRPEWCISSMIDSGDTPFWLETLDMVAAGKTWARMLTICVIVPLTSCWEWAHICLLVCVLVACLAS